MTVKDAISKEREITNVTKYSLVAPEGGWGYVITLAIAVAFVSFFFNFGLVIVRFYFIHFSDRNYSTFM